MGRFVGIDYGTVRIGIAISDERAIIAQPLTLLKAAKNAQETAKELRALLSSHSQLEGFVIGLPLLLSGKEGPMAIEARKFSEALKETFDLPIIFWDERLTTAQVERHLRETQATRKQRRKTLDSMAAAAILQNFLDSR